MMAIVEIGGKQFSVKEQDEITVPRLRNEPGETVTFDRVLLLKNEGDTLVGQPTVENAQVSATVIDHGKDKKVIVFKKKRRKDYRRTRGHRQDATVIRIESISSPQSEQQGTEKNGT